MPLKYKKIIIQQVIDSVEELMDNYIYHIDLANSQYAKAYHINREGKIENVGHSHVLVEPFSLKTSIIDLDGKSTIYMERQHDGYEKKTMYGLCVLILEFLLNIDLSEFQEDITPLFDLLDSKKIPKEFIEELGYCELDIEHAKKLAKSFIRT